LFGFKFSSIRKTDKEFTLRGFSTETMNPKKQTLSFQIRLKELQNRLNLHLFAENREGSGKIGWIQEAKPSTQRLYKVPEKA